MKNLWFLLLFCGLLFGGCATTERLPAEDLEVFDLCGAEISVLRNPNLKPNSKEKYDAAVAINKKVDFTFMREAKTINDIFWHDDALVDTPNKPGRTYTFNYQYENRYIRFSFYVYQTIVLRAEVTEK